MKFIELTDRLGDTLLVNFDFVARIFEVKGVDDDYTCLSYTDGYFLNVQETYTQIKSMLLGE